ncbi:MAG: Holliday junction resolvase RecU [Bacilli bacterium]|nr:Holliday junction resolvase RecU [Bacilli bacterium]
MDLENLINMINDYYVEKNIAIIYKKPTPIQVVKYDYQKSKITDAYYKSASTLDYNGVYKGYYIEFDAKNTNKNYLPLSNIADHQVLHIKRIINHNGIAFLIIMINDECYLLSGEKLLDFIKSETRKSIPYDYIKEKGHKVNYNYLKGIDYITAVDILIKERCDREKDNQK